MVDFLQKKAGSTFVIFAKNGDINLCNYCKKQRTQLL